MPNGKIGDHPFTDIVIHGRRVYSALADDLVREIARLADEPTRIDLADRLLSEYNEHANPNTAALEAELTVLRDRLRADAVKRGWEV